MRKNKFGAYRGTSKNENYIARNPQKQVASHPKTSKKINWNNVVLIVTIAVWFFACGFFGTKLVRSTLAGKEAAPTETAEQASNIQSPKPTSTAQSPEPTSTVQSPEPTNAVQSPKPTGAVQSPKPTGAVQSPKPTGAVQSPKPTATQAPSGSNNQTQNNGTSSSSTNSTLIKSIRERYYSAQSNLNNCEVKNIGTSAKAYFLDGRLILMREHPENSSETGENSLGGFNQDWYYDNGDVYFIFMTEANTDKEYRLYYNNGKLIRWIDSDGKVYNSVYRWDEMQAFYDYAKAQCDSASSN